MGLFDDILGKVTDLTGMGQDAADNAGQMAEDAKAQVEEHVSGITEQLPQDPTEIAGQLFGGEDEQK
jgi:hypothetical protein